MRITITSLALLVFTAGAAPADADPKFEYGKKEEVEGVVWKASAQAGFINTTGNSKVTSLSSGAKASRKDGKNRVVAEAGGAYARSTVYIANDGDGNAELTEAEIFEDARTSTKAWYATTRYDRFLTDNNSLYATALVSGDKPAGKDFVGGGQVGYSRQLYKTEKHTVVGEVGYDFTYEDLVGGTSESIHSARLFAGYEGSVSTDTSALASVQLLANVNSLSDEVGTFDDRRVVGQLALTTKLYEDISFRFGFTAKHDSAPAPRPPIAGFTYGFDARVDKLDTKTEATLIINFL